jgi:MFS family permease
VTAPAQIATARAWYAVILLSLLQLVSYADRLILGILVDPVKSELGLSDTQIGLLIGFSFAALYATLGLVLAEVADRSNRKRLIVIGVLIWSVMTSASAFADSFWSLTFCRLGVGIGEAALAPAALSMISDMFDARDRHLPVSVFLASGTLGATGAFIIGAAAVTVIPALTAADFGLFDHLSAWRGVMLLMGLPGLVLAPLFAITVPEPQRSGVRGPHAPFRAVVAHLVANRTVYIPMFAGLGLAQFVLFAVAAWYPSVLIRDHGLTLQAAGFGFGLAGMIGGTAGALVGPALAVRLASQVGQARALHRVGIAGTLIGLPLLLGAVLADSVGLSLLLIGGALFFVIGGATMAPLAPQIVADARIRARVTALYFLFVNVLGLGFVPVVVGRLNDAFAGQPGATGLSLALVGGTLLALSAIVLLIWRVPRNAADQTA